MVLVFFGAALYAEVRLGVVMDTTLIEADQYGFKAGTAKTFVHTIKLQLFTTRNIVLRLFVLF